ncbi:CAMK protein kinase [Sphaeroforma arctica JP610]|uniref:CAMK protein kinase n=1 Tax=Sphaeroforma arctica JP610 TaxID=667725 RepID=A0A0L0G0Q2_9EUKA|nr:CAMK protein kinase [Sphaeroforma arctica JP610]KNC82687.1 CAMK protein kinase [Sphaeroforma arctica JP610]|eukprot:XP_014156589.1 CAMK protein kinase [Sphaeroforma arctica JP610]
MSFAQAPPPGLESVNTNGTIRPPPGLGFSAESLPPNKRWVHSRSEAGANPLSTLTYDYKIKDFLNKGASANVYLAQRVPVHGPSYSRVIEMVALKQIEKTSKNIRLTRNEVELHSSVHHENIVDFKQYFETTEHYVCVQELMRSDMFEFLTAPKQEIKTDEDILEIVKDVIKGLNYMHSEGIAHRDVKLENIGISYQKVNRTLICNSDEENEDDSKRTQAKLMDLGLSIRLRPGMLVRDGVPGTVEYAAPELVGNVDDLDLSYDHNSNPHEHAFAKADMWAVGILLYLLVSNKTNCQFPWARAHTSDKSYRGFLRGSNRCFDAIDESQPVYRALFDGLLNPDSKARLTSAEALEIIELHTRRRAVPSVMHRLTAMAKRSNYKYVISAPRKVVTEVRQKRKNESSTYTSTAKKQKATHTVAHIVHTVVSRPQLVSWATDLSSESVGDNPNTSEGRRLSIELRCTDSTDSTDISGGEGSTSDEDIITHTSTSAKKDLRCVHPPLALPLKRAEHECSSESYTPRTTVEFEVQTFQATESATPTQTRNESKYRFY